MVKIGPEYFNPKVIEIQAVEQGDASAWNGDILIFGISQDSLKTEKEVTSLDQGQLAALGQHTQALQSVLEQGSFKGAKGNSGYIAVSGNTKYIGFVGLGKPSSDIQAFLTFGTAASTLAKSVGAKSVGVALGQSLDLNIHQIIALGRGLATSSWTNQAFLSQKKPNPIQKIELIGIKDSEGAIKKVNAIVKGTILSRSLVDAPPNICTPTFLASCAQDIQKNYPNFDIEILEQQQCEQLGLGAYLAVAKGSDEPLKFIHLTYKGKNASKKLAVVGKGLTFDTGGYNIKAGAGSLIEIMKIDMGGAAATFGAAKIIAELQPDDIEVHFISASCENMVNGKAYRPGDILTAANGKTIEVNNTDAEGRLTLADALWFAQTKVGATKIVDAATLTGACMVALGTKIGALYSASDDLANKLLQASSITGEKLWRMPLEESYFEQMSSEIADMKNTGGRMGGSITATLFLKQYVDTEKVEWAHLDIPGAVYDEKKGLGTGYGAAVLAHWVLNA